ncbi:TPM domain-containing protein [Microscilla marina]|uniref:TPM domain-containing protein n=1 Tax=Microscilla marina TaxID=1027 RepID=UPI0012F9221F|nr:TPM domain-containing protein [Microscilla marina]
MFKNRLYSIKLPPFIIGLVIVWLTLPVSAQRISETFFVNDWAQVLSNDEAQMLEKKIKAYEDSTSTQIAIVLINSLQGIPIEQQALKIANDWGIGQKRKNNGILILVAIKDRKARIELGKGVTDKISNADARKAIRDMTRPYFRNKQYYKGLNMGVDRIIWLLEGRFKNYKLGAIFYLAALALLVWLVVFIGVVKSKRPPIILGIAFLGVVLMELYWMFDHTRGWIPILATIGWLGLVLAFWQIKEYINDVKWYKTNIKKRIDEIKARQFHKQYIPVEVDNKIQELTQKAHKGSRKQMKSVYHSMYKVLHYPSDFFTTRPDITLRDISQKLAQSPYNQTQEKWVSNYVNWLHTHAQNEVNWCNSLDLSKLSDDEQERITNATTLYQTLFNIVATSLKPAFKENIANSKFLQKDRNQTLHQLQDFCYKTIKKMPSTLPENYAKETSVLQKHLEMVINTPAQVWTYDEVNMLQKMAKVFGVKAPHRITDKQTLVDKLTNRSLENIQNLSIWKEYSHRAKEVKSVQQKMYRSYQLWNTVQGEEKSRRLVSFYNQYIDKGIGQMVVRTSVSTSRSSKKSTYSSTRSNSSYSSDDYNDYGSSSSRGSSSWGGGSFGGDGGSDDW